MRIRFERQGVDKMLRILVSAPGVAEKALGTALFAEAGDIMDESEKIVPLAPGGGTLKGSQFTERPVTRGGKVMVEMGYGGAAAAYALAVHEHPSKHSPPSWFAAGPAAPGGSAPSGVIHWSRPGSGPKFLERPVLAAEKGFGRRIGAHIEAAFKRSFR